MKKKTIRLYVLLIFMLLCSMLFLPGRAHAASKKIKVGKSVTFSVKKAAKWSNSNKKVATMTIVSAKKVRITGLKAGKTTITAKVGKKKYKCKVTVKKVKTSKKSTKKSSSKKVAGAERVSSSSIPGSQDSMFYIDTGATVRGHFLDSMANELMAATNSYRASNGIGTLQVDSGLISAARIRAYETAVVFGHTRPNGKAYYTVNSDIVYGENLAFGFDTSSDTMTAWENSPTHNANLERGQFTKIGIAVVAVKQSDGSYVNYIAQEFG